MAICVINLAANVGKSTISHYVLQPRLGAELIVVEDSTSDYGLVGEQGKKFRATNFDGIMSHVLMNIGEPLIVTVASSSYTVFLRKMSQYRGSHGDYDYFIVPVTPDDKSIYETQITLRQLLAMGVEKQRIRVVLNKTGFGHDCLQQLVFADLIEFTRLNGVRIVNATLDFNEVYSLARKYRLNLTQLMTADLTAFKAGVYQLDGDRLLKLQSLAYRATRNMDAVFNDLALVGSECLDDEEKSGGVSDLLQVSG